MDKKKTSKKKQKNGEHPASLMDSKSMSWEYFRVWVGEVMMYRVGEAAIICPGCFRMVLPKTPGTTPAYLDSRSNVLIPSQRKKKYPSPTRLESSRLHWWKIRGGC